MPLPQPKAQIHRAITYTGIPSHLFIPDSPALGCDRGSGPYCFFKSVVKRLLRANHISSILLDRVVNRGPTLIHHGTAKSTFVTYYDVF